MLDRTAQFARSPQDKAELDIHTIARTEIAANVVRQHANPFGVDSKDGGKLALLPHRAAAPRVNRVALRGFVVVRHRCARLHRHAGHPADVEILPYDMGGVGQDSIRFSRMTEPGIDQNIVGGLVPDRRGTGLHGVLGVQDARQHFIGDFNRFRRIGRLVRSFRNHHCDSFTDVTRLVGREQDMRPEEDVAAAGSMQFHVVSSFRQRIVRDGAEIVGLAVRAGEDAEHTRHIFCRCSVDPDNAGVGMR